ncbi:MAG TPA: polysaccharide deacetylase family protein [Burkholderiales bacterium]|nr:polysaccharide deacetylase family protein [Burkholderiales bacterium]
MGPFSRCLSILIYHRVLAEPDPLAPYEVCAAEFDWQLEVLKRWFTVLPLREAAARLREGTLPVRSACVTFDDGYADNATVALPILRRRAVPATFFVATSFLDGGRMWNDSVIETVRNARGEELDARSLALGSLEISTPGLKRRAIGKVLDALKYLPQEERQRRVELLTAEVPGELPSDLMMTVDQVRQLHASEMEIGAHTVTHPILAALDAKRASAEIGDGKRRLEEITGAPVRVFAYPNGKPGRDYGREHVAMVEDLEFEAAVSTAWGVGHAASDRYQLPRFTPWDRTPGKFALRLLQNTFRTREDRV